MLPTTTLIVIPKCLIHHTITCLCSYVYVWMSNDKHSLYVLRSCLLCSEAAAACKHALLLWHAQTNKQIQKLLGNCKGPYSPAHDTAYQAGAKYSIMVGIYLHRTSVVFSGSSMEFKCMTMGAERGAGLNQLWPGNRNATLLYYIIEFCVCGGWECFLHCVSAIKIMTAVSSRSVMFTLQETNWWVNPSSCAARYFWFGPHFIVGSILLYVHLQFAHSYSIHNIVYRLYMYLLIYSDNVLVSLNWSGSF